MSERQHTKKRKAVVYTPTGLLRLAAEHLAGFDNGACECDDGIAIERCLSCVVKMIHQTLDAGLLP